jgi:iron-sulfur cluster assembly protein
MENLADEMTIEQVTLTSAAANAVKELLTKRNLPDHALRLFVSNGGCSGFQYGMALEENTRSDDHIFTCENVRLIVDDDSFPYVMGATVDYVEDLMGGGFKITNPNAVASCGCGNSFRTKDSPRQSSSSQSSCNC